MPRDRFHLYFKNPSRWVIYFSLVSGFLFTFLLRFVILNQYPYPPSGDAAGDIYYAHLWLKFQLIGPFNGILGGSALGSPPLYYFIIVLPFIYLFPLFLAIKIYMALVPALLVFPSYLLLRRFDCNAYLATIGSMLLALSSPISLMISWNSAYNAFGIFFMLFFFAFLLKAMETENLKYSFLAGLFLSFVAGTHELTLIISLMTYIIFSLLFLSVKHDRSKRVKVLASIFGFSILFSIPYIPVYLHSLHTSANLGYPMTLSANQIVNHVIFGILFGLGQQGLFL
ncbi:MAG: hypothetical protein ACP5OE_09820, partial [Thermodesulfobium sp.]